jgi:putative phage-type endonuclease
MAAAPEDRAAWLAERRHGIGASEAAAACGLSPWMSPLELFLQKTGRAPDVEETLPMRAGTALEPVVLRAFEERAGVVVTGRQERVFDRRLPWRWATLDGRVESHRAVVQAKTAGSADGWGEDGSDQIPLHYMLQVQHELACTECELAFVPVLFAVRELRVYEIPRSQPVIDALTEKEAAFWQRVLADQPPDAITTEDVRLRWPTDSGASVSATAEILDALTALAAAKEERKAAELREDALAATVQRFMGDAATLLGPDGKPVATWKSVKSSRLDGKALAAAHPDIANKFRVETSARRFLLK